MGRESTDALLGEEGKVHARTCGSLVGTWCQVGPSEQAVCSCSEALWMSLTSYVVAPLANELFILVTGFPGSLSAAKDRESTDGSVPSTMCVQTSTC